MQCFAMHTSDEPTVSSSFPEMPTSPRCLEQFVTTLESPFLSSTLSQASATNFDVTLPSTATFRRGFPMDADCLIQSPQSMAAQSNARWHGFRNRKRRDTSLAGRVALPRDRRTGKAAIMAAGKWGDKRQATCVPIPHWPLATLAIGNIPTLATFPCPRAGSRIASGAPCAARNGCVSPPQKLFSTFFKNPLAHSPEI